MKSLSQIIEMRSTPGIFIFDLDNRLLYSNTAALGIMQGLRNVEEKRDTQIPDILDEAKSLCDDLKKMDVVSNCRSLEIESGQHFSLRAFFIGNHEDNSNPTNIMVLIENITQRHSINLDNARVDFTLTKRELEVLRLICEGFTNRKISETLFISEYTVKDHIKKIMKKMEVASRSEIMAGLG